MENSKKEQGFYGKTCNYAFHGAGQGYSAYFLCGREAEHEAHFGDIDSCILWAAYQEFVTGNVEIRYKNALICDGSGKPVMWFNDRDRLLEYAWQTLTDVNTDEDEKTEQDWFIFPAGTGREEIWLWFDGCYSKGVAELLYGREEPPEDTIPWTGRRREPLP